ncbi:hypothetical protein OS493_038744 [Desmophyllum pertusum]|uniref:NACHT domain-containing protein n=1 Tax=Desmophyllum pertusum TaxID=174260 RepID=A0A9X0CMQ8_9CNID|nr:hypothetical protein OS493_038744 [Desmophyllum pertusum]
MEEKLPKVTIHELSSRLSDDVPHVYGRSKETDEVVEAIQSGEEAVVLITGGPGFGKTTVAKRAARELAMTEHGTRTVLFCNVQSTKTLHEVATSMTLICSEQPQLRENPQLWLHNWSKQLKGNVTFVLDNADDVLDRDNGDELFSFVSDIRTLSKQKISFVITCRLKCNSTNLQTKNVRLKCLAGEDAKQVVLSRMKTLQELSKADELVELCGYVPIALCIAGSLLSKAVYTEEELIKCLKQGPLDVRQSNRRPTVDTSVEKSIMTSFEALEDWFYTVILERLLNTVNTKIQPVYRVELLCLLGHETRKEGNQQKYKELMEEAEQIHSKNHTEFETKALSEVYFLNSHARFLSDKKDPKENKRLEQETETALEICREKLGEHPETAATLLLSGIIAKRRKERTEAEQNLTEALELFKKLLGKHLMTAQCLKAIADLYFFLGRGETELDKCLAHYKEATEMFEYLGMGASKEIALTLKNFGSCHMRKATSLRP